MDIYGVIGYPIKHSLSPAMHNAAFEKIGMKDKAKYIKIPVAPSQLEGFLLGKGVFKDTDGNPIHAGHVKGFNITIPHKVKAKEILEKKFPYHPNHPYANTVVLSGAVNTVKRIGDKIEYFNTDVSGFSASLGKDLGFEKTSGKNILVIGCGGAGRAIVADLSDPHHYIRRIFLYDINKKAIDSTQRHFSKVLPDRNRKIEFIDKEKVPSIIKTCQLLVNATPIGMKEGDSSPIDKKLLRKDLYVYDVVYNRETQLVKDAKSLGAHAVTGEGMLAWQGALAFSCWIDGYRGADVIDVMREALNKAISNGSRQA